MAQGVVVDVSFFIAARSYILNFKGDFHARKHDYISLHTISVF